MFGKIFEQIYDSSVAEDWTVRIVFQDLIVLADVNGVVDRTPEAIARRTNVPLDVVRRAITTLESPDPVSRSPDEHGARIVRLDEHRDWGWEIVNYAKYRDIASEEQRREKTKLRTRKWRASKDLQSCDAPVTLGDVSPSPSTYTSSSKGKVGVGGKGFPVTVDDALQQCCQLMVKKDHIMHCFEKANSRGGCDAKGIPIINFPSYVTTEWTYEQNRVAERKARGPSGSKGFDRNKGTLNEGHSKDYDLKKIRPDCAV